MIYLLHLWALLGICFGIASNCYYVKLHYVSKYDLVLYILILSQKQRHGGKDMETEGNLALSNYGSNSGLFNAQKFTLYRLYFGTNIGLDKVIPADELNLFIESTVSKFFPFGCTILRGTGQWLGETGIVKEGNWILEIFSMTPDETEEKLFKISELYKFMFKQEAVLFMKSEVLASF